MKWLLIVGLLLGLSGVSLGAEEALDEVNAVRAARGLRAFVRDDKLTEAAKGAADYRAERLISGHTSNDFYFIPTGGRASAAGCAAWSPSMGWGSCCTYEGYTDAGAAYSIGRDGRRYMHLFVRGSDGGVSGGEDKGGAALYVWRKTRRWRK